MNMTGALEAIHSKRDKFGNCYWAMRYTDLATGRNVCARTSGGEGNIAAIRCNWPGCAGWNDRISFTTSEMLIRPFEALTRDWPYAGCGPGHLARFINDALAIPPLKEY